MTGSTAGTNTAFGAGDSALGYLYQIRMALLTALRRINPADDDDFSIFLETLDDVVFEKTGTPLELFQLKHHSNAQANLPMPLRTSGSRCAYGSKGGSLGPSRHLIAWCSSLHKWWARVRLPASF